MVSLESNVPRAAKAAAVCALILLFGFLCGLLPVSPPAAGQRVLPENAPLFQDSTRQIYVHKGLLFATAVAAIWLALSKRPARFLDGIISSVASRPAAWRWVVWVVPVLIFGLSFRDLSSVKWAIKPIGLTLGLVWFGSGLGDRPWKDRVVGLALLGCSAFLILPGFVTTPDLSLGAEVPAEATEVHYSIVVSAGDRLSQGGHLFANVMPHYGYISPFVLAFVEKTRGLLDFGAHIRAVQVMQVAFAAAAFLCYWLWSRRRVLATAVVFLPILSYVNTLHTSVFCPNQAGWRFLGLPLGLLGLVAIKRFTPRAVALLGFVLGALLLFNPETGVVIGAVYFTYVLTGHLVRADAKLAILRSLASFAVCVAVPPLAFALVFRSALGYWPLPVSHGSSYALTRFAGGFGGLRIPFSVGWIVILVHSIYEIVRSALSLETLTLRRRVRLSIAVGILVWFAYFANRPHPWNLWTYWFLYGFFLIDLVRPAQLTRFRRMLGRRRLPIGLAIVGVFSVVAAINIPFGMREAVQTLRLRSAGHTTVVSGVRFPEAYADVANHRADFVRDRAKKVPLLYFTSNVYLMPLLSGVFCDLPFSDPYVEGFNMDDFEHAVAWILQKQPAEVLFDDPASDVVGSKERQIFIGRLKERLSPTYRSSETTSGWQVWKRAS